VLLQDLRGCVRAEALMQCIQTISLENRRSLASGGLQDAMVCPLPVCDSAIVRLHAGALQPVQRHPAVIRQAGRWPAVGKRSPLCSPRYRNNAIDLVLLARGVMVDGIPTWFPYYRGV